MVTNRSFMGQTWIDLNSPTKEEVDSVAMTQSINPVTANDLIMPTPVQNAKEDESSIYAVLHIPAFKYAHSSTSDIQEIDFVILKDVLITARYDSIDSLHYFAKQIEVSEILNKSQERFIFFDMMKEIYKAIENEMAYIDDWMREIEKNIFAGREKEMLFTISNAGRNLLNFKRTLDPHGDILEFIKSAGLQKFGSKFEAEATDLIHKWRRIIKRVSNQIDLAEEMRETNNSMLSAKQNEIMKQLAVIGALLLPLTIIGQLFGLSVRSFPLINHPYAFWMVIGLMLMVMLISLGFAKFKKWM